MMIKATTLRSVDRVLIMLHICRRNMTQIDSCHRRTGQFVSSILGSFYFYFILFYHFYFLVFL